MITFIRTFLICTVLAFLAGCSAQSVWAPDDLVQNMRYREPGPATVTLITSYNVDGDAGAHAGLLINASERVLFDPAGNFVHDGIPERDDVVFGMNPGVLDFYLDFQTQDRFYGKSQTVIVSDAVAEGLLQRVKSHGPVASAMCSRSISAILKSTPGFESIRGTWFPERLSENFAELPNVTTVDFPENADGGEKVRYFPWSPGQPSRFSIK